MRLWNIDYLKIYLIFLYRISETYRRKAVVKDWFGNGEIILLKGKLQFIQQNEYDVTNLEVNLDGLDEKMNGYHVHMVILMQ